MKTKAMIIPALCAAIAVSGCSRVSRVDPGPDEFLVLPNAQLSDPAGFANLPSPGGVSRAEINPFAQAIAALGGTTTGQMRLLGTGAAAGTGRPGFLARLFGTARGNSDILDPEAETIRLRELGIAVVRLI